MGNSFSFSDLFSFGRYSKIGRGETLTLQRGQAYQILKEQMKLTNSTKVIVNDRDYIALDREKVKKFAKYDKTNNLKYVKERSDCDDFTRVFLGEVAKNVFKHGSNGNRGVAIGEVQGTLYKDGTPVNHSMVIGIFNQDGKPSVELFEPQNDKFYPLDERNTYWSVHI